MRPAFITRPIARVAAALFGGGWPSTLPPAEARELADEVARELIDGDACDALAGFPVLAAFGHVPVPPASVRRPDTYLPDGVCEEGGEFVAKCRGCNEWRPILCDLSEIPAEGYVHHCGGAPWCLP